MVCSLLQAPCSVPGISKYFREWESLFTLFFFFFTTNGWGYKLTFWNWDGDGECSRQPSFLGHLCPLLLLCDNLLHPVGPDHVSLSVSIPDGVSNNSGTNSYRRTIVLGAKPSNLHALSLSLPYESDTVILTLPPRKWSLQEACVHVASEW